jgi:ATP-dependent helicase/DNAse subunit B
VTPTLDPAVRACLAARFGPDRRLSVTRLEGYQACPVRFYIESVLGLEVQTEPSFEVQAQQWGIIVHAVLERLYERGAIPLREVEQRLPRILDAVLTEQGLPPFWQQATRRVFSTIIRGFIAIEEQLRAEGYQPVRVEKRISGRVLPDVLVTGRLDRVDQSALGQRIIDYKTGSSMISTHDITDERTHIQLPLYARLQQQLNPELPVDNIGVFNIRQMKLSWLADDLDVAALIQAALETTRAIIDGIRAAKFPAQPADADTCKACPYGFICPGT